MKKQDRLLFTLIGALSVATAWADSSIEINPNISAASAQTSRPAVPKKPPSAPAKVRDALKVEPGLAVKDTLAKEISLPGVMKISGESVQALDFSRARTISMNNGGSQTIYLSATEPNRIQLPFSNPRIIGTTDLVIDKSSTSNNVYLAFKAGVTHAVQVFLEGQDGGPVLGLQVVPKTIPSQTIIVQDDAPAATADQRKASKSGEYITALQSLMETVALGSTPNGFAAVDERLPAVAMNGLLIDVLKRYSNRGGDIYVYGVSNLGLTPATVRESEFDGDNVQAVSIFPGPLLAPGGKAQVIVIARKTKGH